MPVADDFPLPDRVVGEDEIERILEQFRPGVRTRAAEHDQIAVGLEIAKLQAPRRVYVEQAAGGCRKP